MEVSMAEKKKIPCRVCGKLFEPCAYCQSHADVFRWRNFACSRECASRHFSGGFFNVFEMMIIVQYGRAWPISSKVVRPIITFLLLQICLNLFRSVFKSQGILPPEPITPFFENAARKLIFLFGANFFWAVFWFIQFSSDFLHKIKLPLEPKLQFYDFVHLHTRFCYFYMDF